MQTRINQYILWNLTTTFCDLNLRRFIPILIFFLSFSIASSSPIQSPNFKSLSLDEQLSQGTIKDILHDYKGFIWIATEDGLNKYNGYEVQIFRANQNDSTSINDNFVNTLFEDSKNRLWIGTESSGFALFNRQKQNFRNFNLPKNNLKSHSNRVTNIQEDSSGNLWIGSSDLNIYKFDPSERSFTKFRLPLGPHPTNILKPGDLLIEDIHATPQGKFWITTRGNGLYQFDPGQGKTNHHFSIWHDQAYQMPIQGLSELSQNSDSLLWIGTDNGFIKLNVQNFNQTFYNNKSPFFDKSFRVKAIKADTGGKIWAGTENTGLLEFNLKNGKKAFYTTTHHSESGLQMNTINVITRDRSGIIWLGTNGKGINWFSQNKKFKYFSKLPVPKNGYLNRSVRAIYEDKQGVIWIGSYTGLDRYNPKTNNIKGFPFDTTTPENGINSESAYYNKNVYSLFEDKKERFWMGTEGGGLYRVYRESGVIQNKLKGQFQDSLNLNFIFDIKEGPGGGLWLATHNGLFRFKPEEGDIQPYLQQLSNHFQIIASIHEDQWGRFWLASIGGIVILEPETGEYQTIGQDSLLSTGLEVHRISSFCQTTAHTIWMGTKGGGFSKITLNDNHNPKAFKNFTTASGLPNNVVYGIVPDSEGRLWLSTNKGLTAFDTTDESFRTYTYRDGLQGNEFNAGAYDKTSTGEIYFGGVDGLTAFDPSQINQNKYVPPVVFTGFRILGKKADLSNSISEVGSIKLSYDQNVFSFDFAALDYNDPESNQYAYKMEGFRDEWVNLGTKREVSFTGLEPGSYTLKVKASNNDGIWNNEGASIDIHIVPPFWMTNWFYALSGFLIVCIVLGSFFLRVRSIRKQQARLKKMVDDRTHELKEKNQELEITKEKMEEAVKAKSDFFASMTHEIRTPMNSVIGMADLLSNTQLNSEQEEYVDSIRKGGENLLHIINDILDISKIEAGKMKMEEKEFNLESVITDVIGIFAPQANEKQVDLGYWIDERLPKMLKSDVNRLNQILTNLLSNALKFTHEGYVYLEAKLPAHISHSEPGTRIPVSFSVTDTGIGIDEKDHNKLFKSFSQLDTSSTRNYGGTGLGLSITAKLVEMLGGSIDFESQQGAGTTFHFDIYTQVRSTSDEEDIQKNPVDLTQANCLILSRTPITSWLLKHYLQKWGAKVYDYTDEKNEVFPPESLLEKATLVFWDPDTLDANQVEQLFQSKPQQLEQTWIPVCYQPSSLESSPQFLLKKPLKKQQLQELLKQILTPSESKQDKQVSTEQNIDPLLAQNHPLNILVAEDNHMNQQVLLKYLEKLGYHADVAENGKEAVAKANETPYDVIFMDIQMPEMDGIEAMHQIRENLSQDQMPKIIALTANAMEQDQKKYIDEGMDDCLAKPLNITEFQKKLKSIKKP